MKKNVENIKAMLGSMNSFYDLQKIKRIFEDLLKNETIEEFQNSLKEEIEYINEITAKHLERITKEMEEEDKLKKDQDGFVVCSSKDIKELMTRLEDEPINKKQAKIMPFKKEESTADSEEIEEDEFEECYVEENNPEGLKNKIDQWLVRHDLKMPDLKIVDKDEEER